MLSLPPLSLYVHLPWCARKCPYCDFNSHENAGAIPERAYISRLLEDLDADLHWAQGRAIDTIFIGGGTPSLFSGLAIDALLQGIRDRVKLADNAEITLEANPGSAESAKFKAFQAAGVNRLSIGVQSFSNHSLRALGRVHDAEEAHRAIKAAQDAGFQDINIDLMHGLPQQNPGMALADLEQALDYRVAHLSWYQLTLEPNTVFHRSPPVLPLDDDLADIQDAGHALLLAQGYARYEVSAYARDARYCRHNLNYWHFGDYIGIGAGAHGKITLADEGTVLRTRKTRVPGDYLRHKAGQLRAEEPVPPQQLPLEYLMNALRLAEGSSWAEFSACTGLSAGAILASVRQLQQEGLLMDDQQRLCTTEAGFRFLNSVLERFAV